MRGSAKLILSLLGISAVIVPALLLVFLTSRPGSSTPTLQDQGSRQIDQSNIEDTVKRALPSPFPSPSPSPDPSLSPSPTPEVIIEENNQPTELTP